MGKTDKTNCDDFKIVKSSIVTSIDSGLGLGVMGCHEFKNDGDGGIEHWIDGKFRAAISDEHWPEYVRGNCAAAMACEYPTTPPP